MIEPFGKRLAIAANASKGQSRQADICDLGMGSLSHFGMEFAKARTGIDLLHVPYKGSAPAMTDIIGGFVDTLMISFTSAAPQARDGKVKLLAATATQRYARFPDVPTFAERGFPDVTIAQWYAVLAPTGTPQAIVDKISAELRAVITSDDAVAWMKPMEIEPFSATSDQLGTFIRTEIARWDSVVREAKVSQQ